MAAVCFVLGAASMGACAPPRPEPANDPTSPPDAGEPLPPVAVTPPTHTAPERRDGGEEAVVVAEAGVPNASVGLDASTPHAAPSSSVGARSSRVPECRGSVWDRDGARDVFGLTIAFCHPERALAASTEPAAEPPFERCKAHAFTEDRAKKRRRGVFDPDRTEKDRAARPQERRCCYAACVVHGMD